MTIDRTPKPCLHPKANHQCGTALKYQTDRCRCYPCSNAYSEYAEWMADRKAAGLPSLVPDTRAREHAQRLRDAGWRVEILVARTGVSKWTWDYLASGKPRRIHVRTEKRILAFAVDTDADRGILVDPTGTRRRVEALMTQGWTVRAIQARAGLGDHTLFAVLRGQEQCFASTRDAVRAVYDRLWDQRPEQHDQITNRTVNRAARRGYAPPMAWDETIDDPTAVPNYGQLPDESNTRMDLYQQGLSDGQIGAAVGVSTDAIQKWRTRRNLPSNYYTREGRAS